MVLVSHLTKRYGGHTAVDDLSFTVEEGQIYGFLGPNGAGKSTTMNIMTGCLAATSGQVTIGGYDIFEEAAQAKRLMGYLPEQPPLYLDRTPREYLTLAAAVTDAVSDTQEAKLVWVSSTSLLDDQMNLQVSGGNQDFFLNALGWMVEQESSISIHAKSLSTEYLTINSGTASLLSILLVGVLPLGYLCIGIYIWARRKRQ